MAKYPIKMLKDEENNPFIPLVSTEGIQSPDGETLEQKLQKKLEKENIIAGSNITINTEGNNITINSTGGSASTNLIDNLTTEVAGQGALDARQGKILKDSMPQVINNLTTVDTNNALSAYQGYLLDHKFNDYALKSTLSSVATSGDYNDLVNQPDFWNIKLNPFEQWAEGVYNLNGSLNIQEDMTISGNLSVNNYKVGHEIGDIIITSTNEDPSGRLGGTWELIDKEFIEIADNFKEWFTPSSNVTLNNFYVVRSKHSMKVRLDFTNKVALSDTTVVFGNIDYSSLGITDIGMSYYGSLAVTDGGNGIAVMNLHYSSGGLSSVDVITKTSGGQIAANSSINYLIDINVRHYEMLDEACDKFYWKRTA